MVSDSMLGDMKVKKSRKTREPEPETEEPAEEHPQEETGTETKSHDGVIPEAPEAEDFEKYGVGPVTVPVREATEFMARLEEAKVNPTTLRKSVTDLSHENKFWRDYAMRTHQWAQDLKKRLEEAKKQGKVELDIPPFPAAPFVLQQSSTPSESSGKNKAEKGDADDDNYLKGFAKVIGPYIALGKYLKGDDDNDGAGKRRSMPDETMMIKRVETDGTVMYIPSYMAPQLLLPQPNQQLPVQGGTDKEIVAAISELAKTVAVLNERVRSVETRPPAPAPAAAVSPVGTIKEVIGLMTDIRNALMPVTPSTFQEAREVELEKERIRQKEETRRAELASQDKLLNMYNNIITEDSQRGAQREKSNKEQVGRDFIDRMTEEVKKVSAEI